MPVENLTFAGTDREATLAQEEKASTIHTTMLLISVALSLSDQLSTTAAPPSNISYLSPVGSASGGPHLKMEIGGDDCFAHQSITGLTRKKTFGVQSLGSIIFIRISTFLNVQPLVCDLGEDDYSGLVSVH